MAKIDRYAGNLPAFASGATGTERTIFGEVTQANDLTSQINADFLRGWGIIGPSDEPSIQDFNAAMYTHGQLLAYLHQAGVPEYQAAQEYFIGSATQYGGSIYLSLTAGNIGNQPDVSPSNWVDPVALKANIASPTFTGVPAAPTATAGTNTTQLATTAFTAAGLALKASLAAAQTFTEVQTFGKAVREKAVVVAAANLDLSLAAVYTKTVSGAITLTISNAPADTVVTSIILMLTNGGSAAVTYWSGVKWAGGSPPDLTASGLDALGFFTIDGGTNWTGLLLGKGLA